MLGWLSQATSRSVSRTTSSSTGRENPPPPGPLRRARERAVLSPSPTRGRGVGEGTIRLPLAADDRQLNVGARRRREPGRPRLLECRDLVRVIERQTDVVQAVEQAVLAERLDLERIVETVAVRDRLVFEVDGQPEAGLAVGPVCDRLALFFWQADQEQAVLRRVVEEDIAERRRNNRPEAGLLKRPRRVLAGRSATEVVAGHQHRAIGELRAIEDEIRVVLPPALEEELAPAGPLDPLQVDGWNDLVSI